MILRNVVNRPGREAPISVMVRLAMENVLAAERLDSIFEETAERQENKDLMFSSVAEIYRKRWTIETAFQEMAENLEEEVETLGDPRAALFAFCMALVSYSVVSLVMAALRTAHGDYPYDRYGHGRSVAAPARKRSKRRRRLRTRRQKRMKVRWS